MGLGRLRGRLDQLQGEANLTLDDARDLLADFQDGFGLKLVVDAARLRPLLKELFMGSSVDQIELPIVLKIDPSVDTKG